jgi:predicted nucleic acid-binding Zn ribbon protein
VSRYRPAPHTLAAALSALREELAPDTVLAAAQRSWREVVGEAIAAEAFPTAERAGVLTISCTAAVWAQELDLMAPSILSRLNNELRPTRIERLRCVAF